MLSQNKRITPREEQFIRFLDTVRMTGNEPAVEVLDETLSRLVPPIRPSAVRMRHEDGGGQSVSAA